MSAIQRVRCPNCGDFAERQELSDRQAPDCDRVVQTACEACDYLMIMGFPAGRVLEAYAPSQLSFIQSPPAARNPLRPSGHGLDTTSRIKCLSL